MRPPERINKFLIALQYWKGDAEQAYRLAQYLADLQKTTAQEADFLLFRRFDLATPPPPEILSRLSRVFKRVYTGKSDRYGTGWPAGCNQLWFGVLEWYLRQVLERKIPQYSAIYTVEADWIPLRRDWTKHIWAAWQTQNPDFRHPRIHVMGVRLLAPIEHINGNLLISGELQFLQYIVSFSSQVRNKEAWDVRLFKIFERSGIAELPGAASWWRFESRDIDILDQIVATFGIFHGIKDDFLLNFAWALLKKGLLPTVWPKQTINLSEKDLENQIFSSSRLNF